MNESAPIDPLDFWFEHLGRHLMTAAGFGTARTWPAGTRCLRCGATHRHVFDFLAREGSVSEPRTACVACYSLIRAYPRLGRAAPGRFNKANAAFVSPHGSRLLADLALTGPFERVPESTPKTRFATDLIALRPAPPHMLVFFGQDPNIMGSLRVSRAAGALEVCGADQVFLPLAEIDDARAALREIAIEWAEAAEILKRQGRRLGASSREREKLDKEIARRVDGNRVTCAALHRLPMVGTGVYRAMSWLSRSEAP